MSQTPQKTTTPRITHSGVTTTVHGGSCVSQKPLELPPSPEIDCLAEVPQLGFVRRLQDGASPLFQPRSERDLNKPQSASSVPALPDLNAWQRAASEPPVGVLVVVPEVEGAFDHDMLQEVKGILHYEERQLYFLHQLRNPKMRMVYVTSQPVPAAAVDYLLNLAARSPEEAECMRGRLLLVSPKNSAEVAGQEPMALSTRLLRDGHVLRQVEAFMESAKTVHIPKAGLAVFCSSPGLNVLAESLDLPLLEGSTDMTARFGTKNGSRAAFKAANVPFAVGIDECWSQEELAKKLALALRDHPEIRDWVIKLNEGFSGEGNAILSLADIDVGSESLADDILARLPTAKPCSGSPWAKFASGIDKLGVIAEAMLGVGLEDAHKSSPSVQLYLDETGVHVLSTHDQVLDGQVYKGCLSPASAAYSRALVAHAKAVGEHVHREGGRGHLGVDFFATFEDGAWDLHALEINYRCGGTSHPYETLHGLTGASLQPDGSYRTARGESRGYAATDNLDDATLVGMQLDTAIHALETAGLSWNRETETGVVLHMLGMLEDFGKVGLVAIDVDSDNAVVLLEKAKAAILAVARHQA